MLLLTRLGAPRARSDRAASALCARGETARRGHSASCRSSRLLGPIRNSQFLFVVCLLLTLSAVPATAQVQLPELNSTEPITISAEAGNQWQVGAYEVWVLRGNCLIQQGQGYARSREAVLWIQRADAAARQPHKVIAYLEGDAEVMLRPGGMRLTDQAWLGRFFSSAGVQVRAAATAGKPDVLPPIYWRGMERRTPESGEEGSRPHVKQAQYTAPGPAPEVVPTPAPSNAFPAARPGVAPALVPGPSGPAVMVGGGRRIRVFARSDVPVQFQWFQSDPRSNQWIAVIDSGVNVIVDGLSGETGTLDISTDRLVIWTTGLQEPDLTGRTLQDQRVPLEFYMEGNIVFLQGERTIRAERMYYDVPNNVGTVLNADMLTPVRSYDGLLRLHADVIQQTAKDRFFAQNTFLTSSRIGEPSYRLQAGDVYFEDIQRPAVDALTGQPLMDPATGGPLFDHQRLATATNNFVFIGPAPVFYWPVLATDLNDPTYYIRRASMRQDDVFGTQVLTHWSGYQLLGIRNKPEGTDFDLSLDYLSSRGLGHGGTFSYNRESLFDFPGHTEGFLDYWGIQDRGTDDLGQYRYHVPPEQTYRYRLFGKHRELLPYDLQLSAEVGWISDRNFLEEYYKNEWDELKDATTGLELKRLHENTAWSITADYRVNDFFTDTNWLPRADHFWLGQPLFRDAFTWFEHSNAAYAQFRRTTIPANTIGGPGNNSAGPFNFLAWETGNEQGGRYATRQELDWPFQLGVVKLVPYVLGEAAHWDQDDNGKPLDRLFGQAGVRASMPMWSVDPTVNSDLFNVHGIAHKVVFNGEFSYSQANKNLEDLPLYDPLDDNSVEAFRRRFLTTTFGFNSLSLIPTGAPYKNATQNMTPFDERLYALRTGLQNWVTSPSTEIAGDLTAIRLGAEQRWQTKRGPPQDRRIIDWITLDTNITLFPDANRDNFGTGAGLLDYDFRWHVGDRLTLVSDAIFDFFNQGQKIVSVGGFLTRPPRGSLYLGFRVLQGPTNLNSQVLTVSYNYWMSPKWVSTFGTSVDLGNQGNIGQNFSIMRVGESFLISAGFTVDPIRNNVGVAFAVEPRFVPRNRLGSVGGAQIPPAGAFGLE
jgi:hypothetical protein